MLDDFEQLSTGWQVFIGVAVLGFSVWFIAARAADLQRKDRERRWNQQARNRARNASRASTETATETPGTSTETKGPSAPAGHPAEQSPENTAREENDD